MISLIIWFYLWSNFFVLAPPLLNIKHNLSLENLNFMNSHLSNTSSKILIKQRKTKPNRTTTEINLHQFDVNSYRSSWKFVDKHTIRVRFRLHESLLHSIISTRFVVRHQHSGHIETYDKPHEIINSTLTLYLHNLKHGRHIVCLLLYRSKLMLNPKYVFCQDIIFNFQKYGHHDTDADEHGNTFVFLLTQYSIVLGILCILQLIHTVRKRRFLRAVYDKANALRNLMTEHHHHSQENKSTIHLNPQTHALEYLIYNLNRNAIYNLDQIYMQKPNEDNVNLINSSLRPVAHHRTGYEKHLKIPNRLSKHSITPLLGRHRSLVTTNNNSLDLDEDIFDESDYDTGSYEERSVSFKSLSHILEENKPWMTRFTDNGSIQHSILSSAPLQNTRINSL